MRCPWLQAESKVATILGILGIPLVVVVDVLLFTALIQNNRRGSCSVSNFAWAPNY